MLVSDSTVSTLTMLCSKSSSGSMCSLIGDDLHRKTDLLQSGEDE
jgi:hypothetical protein